MADNKNKKNGNHHEKKDNNKSITADELLNEIKKKVNGRTKDYRRFVDELLEGIEDRNYTFFLDKMNEELRKREEALKADKFHEARHHEVLADVYKSILENSVKRRQQ